MIEKKHFCFLCILECFSRAQNFKELAAQNEMEPMEPALSGSGSAPAPPLSKFPGSSSAPAPQKSKKLGSSSAQLQELEPAPWNQEPGAKNFEPCRQQNQDEIEIVFGRK